MKCGSVAASSINQMKSNAAPQAKREPTAIPFNQLIHKSIELTGNWPKKVKLINDLISLMFSAQLSSQLKKKERLLMIDEAAEGSTINPIFLFSHQPAEELA